MDEADPGALTEALLSHYGIEHVEHVRNADKGRDEVRFAIQTDTLEQPVARTIYRAGWTLADLDPDGEPARVTAVRGGGWA